MLIQYDVLGHGKILADRLRLDAYRQALQRTVRPGSIVVDIGTGTGVMAIAACRAGARRVYAIEPGGVVHLARDLVAANGCAAKVEFIESTSTSAALPERADVIVADVRGVLPNDQIPILLDARRRFLAEGGCLVPRADTLWAAPVSAADLYEQQIGIWDGDADGVDMSPVRRLATQKWLKCRVQPEQLAAEPRRLFTIDYERIESADIQWSGVWTADRAALVHGFAVWFDTLLADGVSFSNRPGAPAMIYGQGFFPCEHPVAVRTGGHIQLELRSAQAAGLYNWQWAIEEVAEPTYA
jgi:protein arginine N-methyltransferase 1